MSKIFLLTEKREAGAQVASALPNGEFNVSLDSLMKQSKKDKYLESENYVIGWASGHLFSEVMPDQINPDYKLSSDPKSPESYRMEGLLDGLRKEPDSTPHKQAQISILKRLINRSDIKSIYIATDSDAEGQAIAEDILTLNTKNKHVPVKRLWITGSFKSKDAIKKAIDNARSNDDDKYRWLYHSQLARSRADYIIGMKLTRCAKETYNIRNLNLGRVKSVIVALVGNRENEINNFQPSNYWSLNASVGETLFSHFYYNSNNEDDSEPNKERHYFDIDIANNVISELAVNDNKVEVLSFEMTNTVSKTRPLPFSGSAFASEMMGLYKISYDQANSILDYLRNEGFTTYPGTNGTVFGLENADDVKDSLVTCNAYFDMSVEFTTDSYIFNDKKAAKQNHPPISVTSKIPNEHDLAIWDKHKLPHIKEAYELIAKRISIAFLEEDKIEKQHLIVRSVDKNHYFDLTGQKAINQGWRTFAGLEIKDTTFTITDSIEVGRVFSFDEIELKESTTKPPSLYTVKTLLDTLCNVSKVIDKMLKDAIEPELINKYKTIKKLLKEAEGIGTDRTRGTIIQDLMELPALQSNKKGHITLTELGLQQFHIYPPSVKSIIMTANWENGFEAIRNGELDYQQFLKSIDDDLMDNMISHIIDNVGVKVMPIVYKRELMTNAPCPICSSDVYETDQSYRCEKYVYKQGEQSGCIFSLPKNKEKIFGRDFEGIDDFRSILASTKDNVFKESKHGLYLDLNSPYLLNTEWDTEISNKELRVTKKTYQLGDKFIFKQFHGKSLTRIQAEKILNGEVVKINRVNKNKKKYSVKASYKEGGGALDYEFA